MVFYFDFANYFLMIRLAWNEKVAKAKFYSLAVLLLAVPIVSSFHAICFFLDGLLFPGLWRVEVRTPVFVVGHARSGTTAPAKSKQGNAMVATDGGCGSSDILENTVGIELLHQLLCSFHIVKRYDRVWFDSIIHGRQNRIIAISGPGSGH